MSEIYEMEGEPLGRGFTGAMNIKSMVMDAEPEKNKISREKLKEVFIHLLKDEHTCISSNYKMDGDNVYKPYNSHIPAFTFETADEWQLDEIYDACDSDIKYGYLGLCGCFIPDLGVVAAVKILQFINYKSNNSELFYNDLDASIDKWIDWLGLGKYYIPNTMEKNITIIIDAAKERIKEMREFEHMIETNEYMAFSLYQLDSCGLIEHGSNILHSWLTDKGRIVLMFYEDTIYDLVKEIEEYKEEKEKEEKKYVSR